MALLIVEDALAQFARHSQVWLTRVSLDSHAQRLMASSHLGNMPLLDTHLDEISSKYRLLTCFHKENNAARRVPHAKKRKRSKTKVVVCALHLHTSTTDYFRLVGFGGVNNQIHLSLPIQLLGSDHSLRLSGTLFCLEVDASTSSLTKHIPMLEENVPPSHVTSLRVPVFRTSRMTSATLPLVEPLGSIWNVLPQRVLDNEPMVAVYSSMPQLHPN